MSKKSIVGAALCGLLGGMYALVGTPAHAEVGATADEVAAIVPGARIVPDEVRGATMATTLDAPPKRVLAVAGPDGTRAGGLVTLR